MRIIPARISVRDGQGSIRGPVESECNGLRGNSFASSQFFFVIFFGVMLLVCVVGSQILAPPFLQHPMGIGNKFNAMAAFQGPSPPGGPNPPPGPCPATQTDRSHFHPYFPPREVATGKCPTAVDDNFRWQFPVTCIACPFFIFAV